MFSTSVELETDFSIASESQLDSTEVLNPPTVQGSEPSNSQVSQELSTHPNQLILAVIEDLQIVLHHLLSRRKECSDLLYIVSYLVIC